MEKWSISKKAFGVIITDSYDGLPYRTGHSGKKAEEYYGGSLIAESVWREKDRKLIAAAPDLLEALQICLSDIDASPVRFTREQKLKIAREAIKKATE